MLYLYRNGIMTLGKSISRTWYQFGRKENCQILKIDLPMFMILDPSQHLMEIHMKFQVHVYY